MASNEFLPRCQSWVPDFARDVLCREPRALSKGESLSDIGKPIEAVAGANGVIIMAVVFLVALVSLVYQISQEEEEHGDQVASTKKVSVAVGFWTFATLFTLGMLMFAGDDMNTTGADEFGGLLAASGAWGLLTMVTSSVVMKLSKSK